MIPEGARTLAIYGIAGAVYIAISVFHPHAILSVYEGIPFLFLMVWLVPRILRVLR